MSIGVGDFVRDVPKLLALLIWTGVKRIRIVIVTDGHQLRRVDAIAIEVFRAWRRLERRIDLVDHFDILVPV